MKQAGLDAIETASRDEISALQQERLAWTLRHAYANVPHYRAAFDAAGVHPDDFRRLEDLRRFPFTTKHDLRANYPFGMFAVPRDTLARIHASSGTTGKPTVVGYTAADLDIWAGVVARSIYASGGRSGMLLHNAYGYGLFTGGLGLHAGAERLGCTVVPVSGGMTERQAQLIVDFRPDIITVTPSYALVILDELRRLGAEPNDCSLTIGIFGAEPWTNVMRAELEAGFGIDAVDIYGLSEVIGPGVANECVEAKDGPVIWEDHFYPEVIDPETGAVLPDGELGELVFTTLTKEAMPVIRYRTRDLTLSAFRHSTQHAPDGEDHRPVRRYAGDTRREPVPYPNRGGSAPFPIAGAALSDRSRSPGTDGYGDAARGATPARCGRGCAATRNADAGRANQGDHRVDGGYRGGAARLDRTLRRQSAPGAGPAKNLSMTLYPSLLQINTRVWLRQLSQTAGRRITLSDIDDAVFDGWAERGFDWIWLLSVWQTGAAGRAVSRANPDWRAEFKSGAAGPDGG